jgi:CDP-paratose 2-epimerase
MEAVAKIEKILGKKANIQYVEQNRTGDHIWYISDVSKLQNHYPEWKYTYDSDKILKELCHYAVSDKMHKS